VKTAKTEHQDRKGHRAIADHAVIKGPKAIAVNKARGDHRERKVNAVQKVRKVIAVPVASLV
jgi:hypothetical protein